MDATNEPRVIGYAMARMLPLALASTLLCGCPTTPAQPGSPDASPPSFAEVLVRLEPVSSSQVRGEFDLAGPDDIIRSEVGSDLALHLIATVGDPESGITNVSIQSELRWRCSFGPNSQLIGVMQTAPVAFDSFNQPATAITPMQINVRADPVGQTGCNRSAGKGPVFISGFVRVTATNGAPAPATTTSMTFIFDYENALGPATGTRLSSGISSDTPYMAECRKRGVPIPPDWSPWSTAWVAHGNLKDSGNNLLQGNQADATVWTYTHPRVRGACIALPRGNGGGRGGLAGIICQSAATGNACFWDSRLRNNANPQAQAPVLDWSTQVMRIAELKDATNITEEGSGACPACHRGENVFIIAPDDQTWQKVMKGTDLGATFTTRVEGSSDVQGGKPRYVPVTGIHGQSRGDPGWANAFQGPGCGSCHEQSGGDFTPTKTILMPPSCANGKPDSGDCYRY